MSVLHRSAVVAAASMLACQDSPSGQRIARESGSAAAPLIAASPDTIRTQTRNPSTGSADPSICKRGYTDERRDRPEITIIVSRLFACVASSPAPDADRPLLRDLPPATATRREPIPNSHQPEHIDTILTHSYPGLEIRVYRVSASNKDIIQTVTVFGPEFVSDEGLRVGLSQAQVRAILGEPFRVETNTLTFYAPGPQASDEPIGGPEVLDVVFAGDSVASLRYYFYID